MGSLLDELVSKLKDSEHLATIAKYVVDGKVRRVQLQAAFKCVFYNLSLNYRFVAAQKDSFDVASFEKECGVGVVVSPEAIAQSVASLCDANATALEEKKWNFQGQLFAAAKNDSVLKWADGLAILSVYAHSF